MSVNHSTTEDKRLRQAIAQMKRIRKRWRARTLAHILRVICTILVAISLTLILIINDMLNGPSRAGSDLLITTLNETSALKFVPDLFMLSEHVDEALARNQVLSINEPTDTSLITVKSRNPGTEAETSARKEEPIQVYDVRGATYKGQMMVVLDPSRVILGVCRSPFTKAAGLHVDEIISKYNGVAGLNGGAFKDVGGNGNGGQALGMVYSQGERLQGAPVGKYFDGTRLNNNAIVAGFDKNDILHVGLIDDKTAEDLDFRDAVAFGPVLIANGVPSDVAGFGSGLNPRSAIGQRADGAVLLLVVDGRQLNSLGASYADLIEIMLDYGAVNACNLDGGSSSAMFLNGEQLNDGLTIGESRALPTAWVVK